ncbi:MAG: recombinase family protein [Bauldia sp.]|nr:recombinase family protein [Bauldia sp.]
MADLKRWLDAEGVVSKRRCFKDGKVVGGVPMSRGAIYQILRNRLYRGEIEHRGEIQTGKHQPIIDQDLWQSVQARLTEQSGRKRKARATGMDPALLAGRAFDDRGNRLTPTYAIKAGRRYRYYVSAPLVRGAAQNGIRVPAPDLECLVTDEVATRLRDPLWVTGRFAVNLGIAGLRRIIDAASQLGHSIGHASDANKRLLIERLVVGESEVSIRLHATALAEVLSSAADGSALTLRSENPIDIVIPARAMRRGKQVRLVIGTAEGDHVPPDPSLLALVSDAYRWFDDLRRGGAGPSLRSLSESASRLHM